MCIISTAQHAKPVDICETLLVIEEKMKNAPNVIGHIEPCRAQFATLSIVDRTYSRSNLKDEIMALEK